MMNWAPKRHDTFQTVPTDTAPNTAPETAPLSAVPADGSVKINAHSRDALLRQLRPHLQAGTGFAVATLNLDHIVKMRTHPAFLEAYRNHSHVTADGNPVVWLSRFAGDEVSLATGSDMIDPLCALAAELEVNVAFFGASMETLDTAKEVLQARHPALRVLLCRSPEMGFDPKSDAAQAHIDALAQSQAGLCFIALGAPNQEIFAARLHQALPNLGIVSIGAGLDFLAGRQTRAPQWVRRLALEWLWRLLLNPKRMAGRYAACVAVLPELVQTVWQHRRNARVQNR